MVVQADHVGTRLLVLRELLSLTQAELAASSGVGQALISQIEKGNRDLTDVVRLRISASTQMPATFFEQTTSTITDTEVHFRREAGAGAKTRKYVWAHFIEAHRIADRLASSDEAPIRSLTIDNPDPLSPNQIESIATQMREQLNVKPGAPVPHLMRAIERLGIPVIPLGPVDSQPAAELKHSGVSQSDTSGRAVIGYFPTAAGDRQRLTIGHELGHTILHAHRIMPEKIREAEAMAFAAALLYPETIAAQDISETLNLNGYPRIKARWGISIQALIRRGRDLDLITADRYRSLMVQLSARGWRKAEPVDVDMERPALMWHKLTTRYGASPFMAASHDLGMAPRFLETWIPPRTNRGHSGQPVAAGDTNPGQGTVIQLAQRRPAATPRLSQ